MPTYLSRIDRTRDGPAGQYLRQLHNYGLLTPAQVDGLAQRVDAGKAARVALSDAASASEIADLEAVIADAEKAKAAIIEGNLRLVVSVAVRWAGSNVDHDFDDIIQAGNIGLMKAVDRFDRTRGYQFSTYAVWWIRQSIRRELDDRGRTVRLPVHIQALVRRVEKITSELVGKLGYSPSNSEVAAAMGITPERVIELKGCFRTPLSLDQPMRGNEDSDDPMYFSDILVDAEPEPAETTELLSLRSDLAKSLKWLSEKQRQVLTMRFGLNDNVPKTLEECGTVLGVSRERIRQIERDGLRLLRGKAGKRLRRYLDEVNGEAGVEVAAKREHLGQADCYGCVHVETDEDLTIGCMKGCYGARRYVEDGGGTWQQLRRQYEWCLEYEVRR